MKVGKIIVVKVDIFIELGWFSDFYLIIFVFVDFIVKKYNFGILDFFFMMCKINNVFKIVV